ncbi:MAG: acylphosphatase [Sedimentisphaerales bacterium]|nr:acylphosphatase [Sedimentisphaerales bacterium]
MIRKHVYYKGTVQGVGFRYTTLHIAANYDITGFAKNLYDGRVELVVEGRANDVDAFLVEIESRMGVYIRDIQAVDESYINEFNRFDIRF